MGNSEELEGQGAAGSEETPVPQGQAAAGEVAPQADGRGGDGAGTEARIDLASDEVAQAIAAAVEKAEAQLRTKYEGPGGDISKLKSQRDKAQARVRQVEQERQAAALEQARRLREQDPNRAVEFLEQELAYSQQAAQMAQAEEMAAGWAAEQLEQLGLESDDPEVVKIAEAVGPLTADRDAAWSWFAQVNQLARERDKAEATDAKKALSQALESIESQVQASVQRVLASSGLTVPDVGEGRPRVPAGTENPIKDITNPTTLLRGAFDDARKGDRKRKK